MNIEAAKKVAKDLKVKGFRKMKLQRVRYVVGKQCSRMDTTTAHALIDGMIAAGWEVTQLDVCRELADKGLPDPITIKSFGAI